MRYVLERIVFGLMGCLEMCLPFMSGHIDYKLSHIVPQYSYSYMPLTLCSYGVVFKKSYKVIIGFWCILYVCMENSLFITNIYVLI